MSLKRTKSLQILCLCLTAGLVLAQQWWEKKPYSEWSAKQVQRMLDRSPWSTVHTVAVLNPGYYQSSRSTGIPPFADDSDYNPTMLGMGVQERLNHFHLRFLTAKPIRLALARDMTVRAQQEPEPAAIERFVQYTDDRFIVLLMTLSSEPPGADSINQYMSTLLTLTTPDLTADTSLATRTGKRVYLARYEPPGPDGLGAKFYFPRKLPDGSPLVVLGDKEVRFETQIQLFDILPQQSWTPRQSRTDRVHGRFKLQKMIFEGKLEI